ncbi:HTH-type transcriptional regulator LeuO [Raoultella terrigena]|uniref:HTH-type transcriptional regulator LeuO n=1 Tax=Raoultella terrigena TaxID=577 RepID=A0A4U9DFT8_RAOTE|nr:HTH-type transcriptional regulator LeuO [Raoultella terrigena]
MAKLYELKKFDLNLLVIFECIYQHLSISQAAGTLFITPSAVSQSLQRLRNQLNDPLFIRSGKGMSPTTLAVNLHRHLEQNLNQLEQTINIVHGAELSKRFVIYSPQFFPLALLGNAYQRALRRSQPAGGAPRPSARLGVGGEPARLPQADLIFSLSPLATPTTLCLPFAEIEMVLVCRQNHPRIADLTSAKAIARERFTDYLTKEAGMQAVDYRLEKLFPERNIAFSSDSHIAILNIISQTDFHRFYSQSRVRPTAI